MATGGLSRLGLLVRLGRVGLVVGTGRAAEGPDRVRQVVEAGRTAPGRMTAVGLDRVGLMVTPARATTPARFLPDPASRSSLYVTCSMLPVRQSLSRPRSPLSPICPLYVNPCPGPGPHSLLYVPYTSMLVPAPVPTLSYMSPIRQSLSRPRSPLFPICPLYVNPCAGPGPHSFLYVPYTSTIVPAPVPTLSFAPCHPSPAYDSFLYAPCLIYIHI